MSQTLFHASAAKRPRFWARQFAPDSTTAQDAFDVIFAVALPIVCFVADPVIFKGGFFERPLLENFQLVTYVVGSVEMGLFLAWRTFQTRLSKFAGVFAAIFALGATVSAVVGVAILPFTLLGLMVIVGILGFIPFLTSFVFLRSSVRALKVQRNQSTSGLRLMTAMLGGVLVMALPVFASVQVEKAIAASVTTLIAGNTVEAKDAADRLRWFRFVPDKYCNWISEAYWREFNPSKREILRQAYQEATGTELREYSNLIAD